MLGVPVFASRVPGNVGLLGDDYLGYYPTGDAAALAELMRHAETDAVFYRQLCDQVCRRQHLFRPERELLAWEELLAELK